MSNKRDEERSWRSDEEYRVGDERPPRHSQFKPGVSGNQNYVPRLGGRLFLFGQHVPETEKRK